MKLRISVFTLIGFIATTPVFVAEQTAAFSVPGMTCASCPFIIAAVMSRVDGVVTVTAVTDTRTALVVFDDAIASIEDIAFASTYVGYEAKLVPDDNNS